MSFLAMTKEELNGKPLDVLLVTGDAYVDHPSWGIAVIGRWLEAHGYTVGIIAQPDWTDLTAFQVLGRPRLFVGVTAGNMDSMVNKFTSSRHVRNKDAYSPDGQIGLRPDRATIAYTAKVKQAFKGVPVVIGGIEASLRRLVHYDYWQDKIRGSILLDSKADLLVHGMGEHQVVEIANRLKSGKTVKECWDINGVLYALGAKDPLPKDAILLPSLEECRQNGRAFAAMTVESYRQANPHCGKPMMQAHGSRWIVQMPPAVPLTTQELDKVHELPYTNQAHPAYRAEIPALQSIQGSIAVNRGCSGGCSFCALTTHQGKDVVSRSEQSVLAEVKRMTQQKGFNGIISDIGGPTANMFHMNCQSEAANKVCRRVSCLHPVRCKHYGTDHKPFLRLLRKVRHMPGIRKVFVNSGIRYDLASLDDEFVEELALHHVQGHMSVAPEHASSDSLKYMKKPEARHFTDFMERFKKATSDAGKKQFLVPYFICAHPGTGPEQCIELALYMKSQDLRPRQVQTFMPTPGTIATAMYVSGIDPYTKVSLFIAKGWKERSRQRALLFYWKKEEWPHVREALLYWGRGDLIGKKKHHLVPPGPAFGAWKRKGAPRDFGGMGMKLERASKQQEREETWEAIVTRT
ncbi:MAG: YgiQ family radical SAM protein [Myxococcota bacterium]